METLKQRAKKKRMKVESPRPTTPTAVVKVQYSKFRRVLHKALSIRVLIIITVVLLVVAAGLLAWLIQLFLVREGINEMSNSVRFLVGTGVLYQVNAILQSGRAVVSIDNGTISYNIQNTSISARTVYLQHLYRLLQSSNSIGSISYTDINGNSVGCRRVASYQAISSLTNTNYTYFSQNAGDNGTIYSYNVDPKTIAVGSLIQVAYNVSALTRPWYIMGAHSYDGGYQWSPIYLSAQTVLTVSAAQPFYSTGNLTLVGVLGVHLFLPRLKTNLGNLTNYGGIQVVLVTNQGILILDSCPTVSDLSITCPGLVSDPISPYPLYRSGGVYHSIDADVISTFGAWDNVTSGRTVTIGDFWITYENIFNRNLHWVAIIMIDSRIYLKEVDRANTGTIIGIVLFSVLCAVLAAITGMAITRPISRTISQMDRISTMDFTKLRAHRPSKMNEIKTMEKSLSRMRTALNSFEKFVPNRVIKEILKEDNEAHLGVAPVYATVFFCDIEDFTTIAELMDPASLVGLLLDFLQEMSNIILDEAHGTIDKFIGDAIMAFWNAPHPVENHPEMACLAALRCRKKIVEVLQPKWADLGIPEGTQLNARFGIHTGDMLVGNIGSFERINYTAIGDNVNIAARLESLCKFYGVRILISAITYDQVKNRFLCRPLDMVVVKGKSQHFILYELVCEKAEATEAQTRLCTLQELAASHVFVNPNPDQALAAYEELHINYPEDVSIERVRERLMRLQGSDHWPGMEIFDQK